MQPAHTAGTVFANIYAFIAGIGGFAAWR